MMQNMIAGPLGGFLFVLAASLPFAPQRRHVRAQRRAGRAARRTYRAGRRRSGARCGRRSPRGSAGCGGSGCCAP
ncbi:hypothetical protein V2I01_36930 [Micromonospora sp. BRA006-A]|nr:hypothetical protein [Micromonospora sp. BRA006-A]